MFRRLYKQATWATCLLITACGEPLGVEARSWKYVASIPTEYYDLSLEFVGPEGLYCFASSRQKLIVFNGNSFEVATELPGEYDFYTGVTFYRDEGWLTGVRSETEYGPCEPFLERYTEGGWTEEKTSFPPGVLMLYDLTPVNPYGFYCIAKINETQGQPEYLASYKNGYFKIFQGLKYPNAVAYVEKERNLCVLDTSTFIPTILVTGDDGANWAKENINVPSPYVITSIRNFKSSPDALYIVAHLEGLGLKWYAIIKRTGRAGLGCYALSYLSYTGPGRGVIEECIFRDASYGIATGEGSVLYHSEQGWTVEDCNPHVSFTELTADPSRGFWSRNGNALYWHY